MSIFAPMNKVARPLGADPDPASISTVDPSAPATQAYPWLKVSADTKALQAATNVALVAAGYCPLVVDGKLGPATCGARNRLTLEDKTGAVFDNPATCTSFATPVKASAGCGAKPTSIATIPKPPATVTRAPVVPEQPTQASTVLKVGAVVVIAGLGLYLAKKKGMI